jgi:hypothetical protein
MKVNRKGFFRIFKTSCLEAVKGDFWKWASSSFGLVVFTTFIVPILTTKYKIDIVDVLKYTLILISIIFLFRFAIIFIKETLKHFHELYKESVYGDTIILLKDSFSLAHYYRKTPDFDDKDFMLAMMNFCNNLKDSFDGITRSKCSVSIKVPVSGDIVKEGTELKNLTRNTEHSDIRDTPSYSQTSHTILGNSAFSNCLENVLKKSTKKYYINNNINDENNYRNTSKTCYPDGVLPYSSELVFPIVRAIQKDTDNYNCHGFICIDSDIKNAFDEKYDPSIVEGVADGIYDLIKQLNFQSITPN